MRKIRAFLLTWPVALSVVLLVGLAIVVHVHIRAPEETPVPCLPSSAIPSSDVEPGPGPSGALTVSEIVFDQTSEYSGRTRIAAVIENTSPLTAYHIPVLFDVLDKSGTSISHANTRHWQHVEIPVLVPGQRIGVAAELNVQNFHQWKKDGIYRYPEGKDYAVVAKAEISFGDSQWESAEAAGEHLLPETRTIIKALRRPSEGSMSIGIDALALSPYCEDVRGRGIVILYRDSSGALLGGEMDLRYVRQEKIPRLTSMCYSPVTIHRLSYNWLGKLPVGTDADRTEVYFYCDPKTPPGRITGSLQNPVN
jgi:hypothetical protein